MWGKRPLYYLWYWIHLLQAVSRDRHAKSCQIPSCTNNTCLFVSDIAPGAPGRYSSLRMRVFGPYASVYVLYLPVYLAQSSHIVSGVRKFLPYGTDNTAYSVLISRLYALGNTASDTLYNFRLAAIVSYARLFALCFSHGFVSAADRSNLCETHNRLSLLHVNKVYRRYVSDLVYFDLWRKIQGLQGMCYRIWSMISCSNCLSLVPCLFLLPDEQGYSLFEWGNYSLSRQLTKYIFFQTALQAERGGVK